MKALGVDPGAVRIGVAVSDESGILARPLAILKHISRPENARRILALAQETQASCIVVGVPFDSDGGLGPSARASIKLIEAVREIAGKISVIPWDESHSTNAADEASRQMGLGQKRRQGPKDDRAAALILQDYLNARAEGVDRAA